MPIPFRITSFIKTLFQVRNLATNALKITKNTLYKSDYT